VPGKIFNKINAAAAHCGAGVSDLADTQGRKRRERM
jgi:hypothetical protein